MSPSARTELSDPAGDGRLPTFLVAGAEKAGTTTLYAQLGQHPNVQLSNPKEPHFFDLYYDRGLDWYAQEVFGGCQAEASAGEATPTYLWLPYVANRIAKTLPDAKIIFTLRNPVERAYSAWWMFWVRGLERLPFEQAIEQNREEIAAQNRLAGPDVEGAWTRYVAAVREGQRLLFRTYLQGGRYAEHLEPWLDAFPPDQIKILLADELFQNRADTLEELWTFIGVDPAQGRVTDDVKNEAMGRYAAPLLRVAQATRIIKLAAHLPEPWRMAFKRATSWMGQRPPMDPATRQKLEAYFESHNAQLEKRTELDLSTWRTTDGA